ncbi:MAG: SPOR domain-containing protein [Myxococcota bacterium]
MAGSRIRNAFSRTTILTVGKLLLFIVVGFAGGLVLGVASEEPELLAGHLRGETTTVELEPVLARGREVDGASETVAAAADDAWGDATRSGAAAAPDSRSDALPSDERALPDVAAMRVEPAEEPSLVARLGAWVGGMGTRDDAGEADTESGRASDGSTGQGDTAGADASGAGPWAIQVGAFGDSGSADRLADRLEGKGYSVAVLPASATSSRWRVRVQPIEAESEARSVAKRIERDERLPTWVLRIEASSGR